MPRVLLLLLPLASACLNEPFGNGDGGGPFRFGYNEADFLDDFGDVACEYAVQCFEAFNSVEECEVTFDSGRGETCPDFTREQARRCILDVEEATETCAEIPSDDEAACANVCG